MVMRLAPHIQASVKPVVGRDRLLGCTRTVTFHMHTGKGMNNAQLAMKLCIDENVAGIGRVGGSPRWMVLYGITACISDAFSVSVSVSAHPGCLARTPEQNVRDAAETSSYSSVQLISLKRKCASLKQIRHSLFTSRTIIHHVRQRGSHFLYISWAQDFDSLAIIYTLKMTLA